MPKIKCDVTLSRRRAILTDEQFAILLTSTRQSTTRRNLTGTQRCWLYFLASQTGLRAGELHSLTPQRAARARGSQIGPRKHFLCPKKATELLDKGVGQIKVAKALGVGVGRINKFVHEQYMPAKQRQKVADGVAVLASDD